MGLLGRSLDEKLNKREKYLTKARKYVSIQPQKQFRQNVKTILRLQGKAINFSDNGQPYRSCLY